MNMEDPIEMKQKGLFRGHPKISKKLKTLLGSKFRDMYIVKVGHFWKFAQSQSCPKCIFLQMGPTFYACILFLTWSTTHEPLHASFTYLFNLLWFYSFKIQIKSNKIKINHISCFWDDFGIEWRWYMLSNKDQIMQRLIGMEIHDLANFGNEEYHLQIKYLSHQYPRFSPNLLT